MNSKKIICFSVAAAVALSIGSFAGCVTTNSEEDVKQTIAVVNIAKNDAFKTEFGEAYASAVTDDVILKRDLYTMYFSGYYQYGFATIKDVLVTNSIITQYATVSLLHDKVEAGTLSLDEFKNKTTMTAKYEYILGGEEAYGVRRAKYSVVTMINGTIDSHETSIIKEDNNAYVGTETRSTPSGIDTLQDEFLPDAFGFYTGYGKYDKANAGSEYDEVEGTTRTTRRRAYSRFISSLESGNLITANDTDRTDVWSLSFVQDNYVSQLQQSIIEEFGEAYDDRQEELISSVDGEGDDAVYSFVKEKYDNALKDQEKSYASTTDFESAMGTLSDTSFILYSPTTKDDTEEIDGTFGTFGYVYNILLPFSSSQNIALKTLQTNRSNGGEDENTDGKYFEERNKLLKNIVTTDQRSAWFNGATDYSFSVKKHNEENPDHAITDYFGKDDGRDYLFFENNLTRSDKYEALEKYDGRYSYNGKVKKNADESYSLSPEKLTIDGMLKEFAAYVNYVVGGDVVKTYNGDKMEAAYNPATGNAAYYQTTADEFIKADSNDKEIDYSKLVYATGKVELTAGKGDMLTTADGGSDRYKAMCAVNELQYAYTTDTGVLSQYIGYTVSAYETSYIKEFEYAAQQALRMGAGAFKVCAGDYGWHLIYVTDAFSVEDGAEFTPVFNKANVEKEGTFENRFFNWVKDSVLTDQTTKLQSEILKQYNNDTSVKTYENAYKDLLG